MKHQIAQTHYSYGSTVANAAFSEPVIMVQFEVIEQREGNGEY